MTVAHFKYNGLYLLHRWNQKGKDCQPQHQQYEYRLQGIEPNVFKKIIYYLYSDTICFDENDAVDVLGTLFIFLIYFLSFTIITNLINIQEAADRFGILRLKGICEEVLYGI